MSHRLPDVDIDFADRERVLDVMPGVAASMNEHGVVKKHNTGVYVTDIPVEPLSKVSSIDYREAEDRGYFKLDVLNVGVYENVKDEKHLVELVSKEPDWSLLQERQIVDTLFHIHNHFDIVNTLKPKSVEQLASVLAIIRPAKRHLAKQNWDDINRNVWKKPTDGTYFFKKSHAIGYALAIVLQLNLLVEQANSSTLK